MTPKIVFLNGPPRSGKDTAGEILHKHLGAGKYWFAEYLKKLTHDMYGIFDVEWNGFEDSKDIHNDRFLCLTPRQAYIRVSERVMKPYFGEMVFGERLIAQMVADIKDVEHYNKNPATFGTLFPSDMHPYFAICDSGFESEAIPIITHFGKENCIQIKIARDGYNFLNDSRSYWDGRKFDIKVHEVHNATLEQFQSDLLRIVKGF